MVATWPITPAPAPVPVVTPTLTTPAPEPTPATPAPTTTTPQQSGPPFYGPADMQALRRKSIALTGGPSLALAIYLGFYASCLALTWWFYLRRSPQGEGAPSLAEARV